MERRVVEEIGIADHEFRAEFADFVIVAVGLPHVEFGFENPPHALSADIGCRDVMKVADTGFTTEVEHPPRPVQIRFPRFLVRPQCMKREAGRVVHDGIAVASDPPPRGRIKSQVFGGQVAGKDHRPGIFAAVFGFPAGHQAFDSRLGGLFSRRAHQQGQVATGLQDVPNQVVA